MSDMYELKKEIGEIARKLLGSNYLSERAQKVVEEIANDPKLEKLYEEEE